MHTDYCIPVVSSKDSTQLSGRDEGDGCCVTADAPTGLSH